MRIAKGEKAKKFTGVDFKGVPFDSEVLGGKKILLSFYRYASCPFCNLRIHRMISLYAQYKKAGVELVAVFQSPPESIQQYVGKQNIPFTVLTDPERKLYDLYGVESSWLGFFKVLVTGLKDFLVAWNTGFRMGKMEGVIPSLPADFLIDEDFEICEAYYGNDVADHIPFAVIDRFSGTPNSSSL